MPSLLLVAVVGSPATSAVASYKMVRDVIASAGGAGSNENRALNVTVGQPLVGEAMSAVYVEHVGFWTGSSDGVVSVDESAAARAPAVTRLHQNHPNPFNPLTTIAVDLAGATGSRVRTRLVVHDIQGRSVATVLDEALEPGRHRVVWDGTSDAGTLLASGVYWARLTTPRVIDTVRFVLLR